MMLTRPRIGQRVQCWYRRDTCHLWPLHGKVGVVEVLPNRRGRGPNNIGVRIDGELYVVPAGNLRKVDE